MLELLLCDTVSEAYSKQGNAESYKESGSSHRVYSSEIEQEQLSGGKKH